MSTRRVIKILDKAYEDGFEHGLTSSIRPNSGHYREGIWARLNKHIGWAYMAGARAGKRRAEELLSERAS